MFEGRDWLYGIRGRFPIVRCEACGLGYLAERPSDDEQPAFYPDDAYYSFRLPAHHELFSRGDLRARGWYHLKKSVIAHRYGYRHLGGRPSAAWLLGLPGMGALRRRATFNLDALLHPWVRDGALLEVGCGSGMYLDLMRALGWQRVVGVDLNEKAVRQARDVLGLDVRRGNLSAVGLETDAFDAVSISHTLEHVADPVAFLTEVRRVMRPGGRLALVVPNLDSLSARVFGAHWVGLDPPRHLVDFTANSLRLALVRAGLLVETIASTPRSAYDYALFSDSRRAGDERFAGSDAARDVPLHRKLRARALALRERTECAMGKLVGEELVAVAKRPL